jgi:uncharacterized membrane protein
VKRPLAVTILGCLFIVVGLVGLLYHSTENPPDRWIVVIAGVRILAIVGGIFLIKGHNWARWLVLAWLALHVGISAFNSLSETLAHAVLLIVIGYFLLTPPASKYFEAAATP